MSSLRSRSPDDHGGVLALEKLQELDFVLADGRDRNSVEIPVGRGPNHRHLVFRGHWLILGLLEQLDHALAAIELGFGCLVEVAGKLGERREFAILREAQAQRAGDFLHRLGLGVAADAADRETDRYSGTDARVEEVGFEINLPVGDRDDVRRDVRRVIAFLRLDDRQRGQRAAAFRIDGVVLRRVGIEFAARSSNRLCRLKMSPGNASRPGDGAAARKPGGTHGVLRKIIINDQRMAAKVAEILAHRAAGCTERRTASGPGCRQSR